MKNFFALFCVMFTSCSPVTTVNGEFSYNLASTREISLKPCENYLRLILDKIYKYNHIEKGIYVKIVSDSAEYSYSDNKSNIYISKSFLKNFDSDDEIAFILLHEMTHILLGHHEKKSSIYNTQLLEIEADKGGFNMLINTRYNVYGSVRALLKAQHINNENNKFSIKNHDNSQSSLNDRLKNLYVLISQVKTTEESIYTSRELNRCKAAIN